VTKSGKKFAANANDWQFWNEKSVPEKLKELQKDGF
jgi:hypothetical protein